MIALWLTGETWNISSIVGVIGLFGLAVQHSLILISQAKRLVAAGMPFLEALKEAGLGHMNVLEMGSRQLSNIYCLPGGAGGSPDELLAIGSLR